jgi:hypothetical protein
MYKGKPTEFRPESNTIETEKNFFTCAVLTSIVYEC